MLCCLILYSNVLRMFLFFTRLFYCSLCVLLQLVAVAQVSFTTTLSATQIAKNEYLTIKFTVANSNNVEQITPPNLAAFELVSGPNQETAMNTINGVVQQSIALSYILLPKKTGKIAIQSATASIDGKIYKSNAVTVFVNNKNKHNQQQNTNSPLSSLSSIFDDVMPKQQAPQFDDYILKPNESVPDKVNKNMQLRLEANKKTCYEGEPIIATYKLYTRLRSESNLTKNPSFNGFSVIDMMQPNDGTNYSNEKLNGKMYNAYTLRRVQLFPLQAGDLNLETASIDNKINFIKYSGKINGNYNIDPNSMVTENVTLTSNPLIITVKPLPTEGKPINFNGAVGNFDIKTSLQKNRIGLNETGKLLVTISGAGNLQLITCPKIQWPSTVETFDAKLTDNIDNSTVPLSGSKTFEIPFTVNKIGNLQTPNIQFSFFNPNTASYKTVTAAAIPFTVAQYIDTAVSKLEATANANKPTAFNSFFAKRWLVILMIATTFIIGLVLYFVKGDKKENKEEKKQTTATVDVTKNEDAILVQKKINTSPLIKTEDCLLKPACVEFYKVLNGELKTYLSEVLEQPEQLITAKNIGLLMDAKGINNSITLQTQQLLQDVEWQLYTPFERNETLNSMYQAAQTIIQQLQKLQFNQ